MENMKIKHTVSLTILGLLACGSITEPDRDVTAPLQTDRLSYSFTRDDSFGVGFFTTPTIKVVVTNTSGATAFLTRGERRLALVVEGLENGEWVTKYDSSIADGGGGVVRLEPGESHTFEDTIKGVLPGTCECQPIIAFGDGIYRFRIADGYVDFFEDEFGAGDELPTEFRISNRFFLDAP